ncbi:hypothetical protein HGRIS_004121 [Hohenbuehelia grisea]|uniref:DUF6534 domain-containing protein n=1 Tax=Hohenbuehelia grisea TaxID=104357 RepID=A0ABR3JHM0_9AGAR
MRPLKYEPPREPWNTSLRMPGENFVIGGLLLGFPLYGVALAQAISYYRNYQADPRALKLTVALLLLLEPVHLISLVVYIWDYFIRSLDPRVPHTSGNLTISLAVSDCCTVMIIALVQCAYALRVWYLLSLPVQKSKALVIPMPDSVFGFFNPKFRMIQMALSTLGDILITGSLVFHLRVGYSQNQLFVHTKSLLDYLIVSSIATGLLTSILSLLGLIFFALNMTTVHDWLNGFRGMNMYSLVGPVYINAYLASLNLRNRLHKIGRPGTDRLMSMALKGLDPDENNDSDLVERYEPPSVPNTGLAQAEP